MKGGVEEGTVLVVKGFGFFGEVVEVGVVGLAGGEHVPVGEAGAGVGGVCDFFEEGLGGFW